MNKTICESNFAVFCNEFAAALQDGWEIVPGVEGTTGYSISALYEIELVRNDDTVGRFKATANAMNDKPKLTKEEQAARAREGKARLAAERALSEANQGAVLDVSVITAQE